MSTSEAHALWLEPPDRASIRYEPLPDRAPDDLLIRTLYTAVSRGTETLIYRGRVPASEYERMRAPFQAGDLPGPVRHGYANSGVVEAGPSDWIGERVFCLFGHQTRYVVPTSAVVRLPADVPSARAVLAANVETAINALWDAAPRVGDRIAVVGAGVLGCLVAWLAGDIPGVQVTLVDIHDARARIAEDLDVTFELPDDAPDGQDLVFHASATAAGLNTALALAGRESEIIELSWYGDRVVGLGLGGAFHSQRLQLRASQVGTVSPARAARWDRRRRLALAVALCRDPRLDVLFAPDADFSDLPYVMARLAAPHDTTLCQRIRYPQPETAHV